MRYIDGEIEALVKQVADGRFERVIGTSGTILSLGTMAAADEAGEPPEELRNLRVPAKQIRRRAREGDVAAAGRAAPPARPRSAARRHRRRRRRAARHDPAAAGAEEITLCDLALREGLILDYIHQHRKEIARADRYPDVRRRSVVELAERCSYWRRARGAGARSWRWRCSTRRAACTG